MSDSTRSTNAGHVAKPALPGDAAAFSSLGTPRDSIQLPAEPFDGTVNTPVMHRAVTAYLANQRQGNAATKIRKFVTGGNQKPWKQKGTGRARQGSIRSPNWVGGGTVFGPTPRSYAQYVPRQVRALARKSALNARALEGALKVIDNFGYDRPQTSRLQALLDRLELADRKVLILTDGIKPNVYLSGRNIPTVHVMPYGDVSTYHVLWSDVVLVESSAIGQTLEALDETAPPTKERPARQRAAAAGREAKPAASAGTVGGGAPRPSKRKAVATTQRAKKATAKSGTAKKSAAKKMAGKKPAVSKKTAAKKKRK
jgi:large subunit ribosomal protein L4